MAGTPGPEGIVFGAGDHLPDASLFDTFDFSAPKLSLQLWELPGHPDALLRLQPEAFDEESAWQLARYGITHLKELRDNGIAMPAQRFVVGPDEYRADEKRLYTVTERITGRQLTYQKLDIARSLEVIIGTAAYTLSRISDPNETQVLHDVQYPWQYTVLDTSGHKAPYDFKLHDNGLEFTDFTNKYGCDTLRKLGVQLVHWCDMISFIRPKPVRQLLKRVEDPAQRRERRRLERANPSLKRPQQPPREGFAA